ASDWDVNQYLWTGRMRIIARGDNLFINLEDGTTGELFAQCPYNLDGTSVEQVLDSSRYFVLTIVDQASGKHAFIGIGFPERSYAFDFNVALQDHVKLIKARRAGPAGSGSKKPSAAVPAVDYTLKTDQMLTINIGG
ncbi:Adaptin ear-binding coat-associated protein 2, partial [Cladochytrium tenue]